MTTVTEADINELKDLIVKQSEQLNKQSEQLNKQSEQLNKQSGSKLLWLLAAQE